MTIINFQHSKPNSLKIDEVIGYKNFTPYFFRPMTIVKINTIKILKKVKERDHKNSITHFTCDTVIYHKVFDVRVFSSGQLLCLSNKLTASLTFRAKAGLTSRQYVK